MNTPDKHRFAVDWRSAAKEMAEGAKRAIGRFPVTTLFLALATINANLLVDERSLFADGKNDFVAPLLGGVLASLSTSLFWEARTRDPWIRHCAAIIAALFGFGVLWLDRAVNTLDWSFIAAVIGFVPVAAYIGRGSAGSFWRFSAMLLLALLLALLALLLIAGGISAILASLTYLFAVPVPSDLYAHVWIISGVLAAPLFGLGQIPAELTREIGVKGAAERSFRALGEFLAAPLLLAYGLILHAYALKILLTRDAPQGQVGWLVLAFGTSVIGSLVVCRPFMRADRAASKLFLRTWPFALIVPLVLLGYALALRIGTFGITPERYLLALFGVVLAVLVVLQWSPVRDDTRPMVFVPALALLLASFGPQGANAISERSQAHRFMSIVRNEATRKSENDEALTALRYLAAHDALALVAPEDFNQWDAEGGPYRAIALAWGLDPDRPLRKADRYFSLTYPRQEAIPVSGFDLVVPDAGMIVGQRNALRVAVPDDIDLTISLARGELRITTQGDTTEFPIDEDRIAAIVESGTSKTPMIVLEAGNKRVLLAPSFLYGERGPREQIRNFAGAIFLRRTDWE